MDTVPSNCSLQLHPFPNAKTIPNLTNLHSNVLTFTSKIGEIPCEIDLPTSFSDDDKMADMVRGWQDKTDYELRELNDVIGYFHHETFSGLSG
uniref:Uncharacterized protein n=1 Tax=Caenorhabditis tropicalis TaxID=1561998 RepID=A0A1I7TVG4_9PELO